MNNSVLKRIICTCVKISYLDHQKANNNNVNNNKVQCTVSNHHNYSIEIYFKSITKQYICIYLIVVLAIIVSCSGFLFIILINLTIS